MPLYRHKGALYYFAHVPKCGGRSVEYYLQQRWGAAAFLDDAFYRQAPRLRWLRASPQHVTWEDLCAIFPEDWISASFAVVRHPLARLVSEYNYLSRVRQVLPAGMNFAMWIAEARYLNRNQPYSYDNHIRPQNAFIPEDARVFRLEDGLEQLVPHIDALSGDQEGPREIEKLHQTSDFNQRKTRPEPVDLAVAQKFITRFYRDDLERFGYDAAPSGELIAHVPVGRVGFRPFSRHWRLARKLALYRRPTTTVGEL